VLRVELALRGLAVAVLGITVFLEQKSKVLTSASPMTLTEVLEGLPAMQFA